MTTPSPTPAARPLSLAELSRFQQQIATIRVRLQQHARSVHPHVRDHQAGLHLRDASLELDQIERAIRGRSAKGATQ